MPIEINSSTAKAGSYVIAQNLPYSAGCSMEQIFTPINIVKGGSAPGPGFARPLTPSFEKGMFNNESVGPTILELNPYFPVIFGDDGSNFISSCDYNLVVHAPSTDFNLKKLPNGARRNVSQIKTQGLRSPLILSGWGYDIAGMPVPTNNGTDFNPSMMNQRSLWKTGPLHVMWDDERQIWTGGYQIVYGVIKQKINHPNGPLASTTFKVKVLRRINGELSTDLGEEITCKNRDIDFQYQIADEDIDDEKVFVVCARINYEWIILWKSKKDNIYMGKFKGEWKFGETKIVEQTSPEPRESEKYRQVVNSIYQNISGKGEEEINCIFSYFDDIFQLISLEVSNPVYFGYFMGKWDFNDDKTVRQTKPEPAAGQEEVQVTNTLFEKDIAKPNNELTTCSFTKIGSEYYLLSVEPQANPVYIGYFTGEAKRGQKLQVTQIYPEPSDPADQLREVENNIFDRAGEFGGARNYCGFVKVDKTYQLISIQPRNQHYFGTYTGEWKKNEKKLVKVITPTPPDPANTEIEVENLIYEKLGSTSSGDGEEKPKYCYFVQLAPAIGDKLGQGVPDKFILVAAEETASEVRIGYFGDVWRRLEEKDVVQVFPSPADGETEVKVENLIFNEIGVAGNEQHYCSFTKIDDKYYLISADTEPSIRFGTFSSQAKRGLSTMVTQTHPPPNPEQPQFEAINLTYDEIGEPGGGEHQCSFTKIKDKYYIVSVQQYDRIYIGSFTGKWNRGSTSTVNRTGGGHPSSVGTQDEVTNLFAEVGEDGQNTAIYVGIDNKYYLIAAVCSGADETGSGTGSGSY